MRMTISTIIAATMVVASCGGDDDAADDTTPATATEVPATDPPATDPPATDPPATDPPATDPPATDPPATEAPAATDAATTTAATTDATTATGELVEVSMIEWEIIAPTEFAAGAVTFEATNDGEFPHEFVVVRGESYETLPQLPNGAVDEDALPEGDFIGRIERFDPGQTVSATYELEPGNYVLLCNIAVGPNAHAAAGQVLSVTVTG